MPTPKQKQHLPVTPPSLPHRRGGGVFYTLIKQIEKEFVSLYDAGRDKPDYTYMKINICSFIGGMLLACLAHKMAHCCHVRALLEKGKHYGHAVEGVVKDSFHRMKEEAAKRCCEHGACPVPPGAEEHKA